MPGSGPACPVYISVLLLGSLSPCLLPVCSCCAGAHSGVPHLLYQTPLASFLQDSLFCSKELSFKISQISWALGPSGYPPERSCLPVPWLNLNLIMVSDIRPVSFHHSTLCLCFWKHWAMWPYTDFWLLFVSHTVGMCVLAFQNEIKP